jgi:hypothetical protein
VSAVQQVSNTNNQLANPTGILTTAGGKNNFNVFSSNIDQSLTSIQEANQNLNAYNTITKTLRKRELPGGGSGGGPKAA